MNIIASIVLCLAMLLGGGGDLPAEPEAAVTWTLRNVVLTLGDESAALTPEAHITAAAGSERASLHFEIANGGKVSLPVTLDAAPDLLRFSLTGGERAYSLSAAEMEEFITYANPGDAEMLEVVSDYIRSYATFIGSLLRDPEAVRRNEEAVTALILERCATPDGETTVEVDGRTYPAQKLRIRFDFSTIDALCDCGWPELEALLDGMLNLLNRSSGLSADSFEEFYASAANNGMQAMPAMPELLCTVAETEDFTYYGYGGMDFESGASPAISLKTERAETIVRADGATANVEMTLTANGAAMEISLDEVLTGAPDNPDIIDVDCAVRYTSDAESGAAPVDFAVTFDAARNAAGKFDGVLRVQCPAEVNGAALPFGEFSLGFAQVSEDGAVTVSLATTKADEAVAVLDFDVLRTEAAPEDYFAGAQMYEVTAGALESDEANPLAMALFTDVSQLSLDGMQLLQDPSVQAMGEMIQRFSEELAAAPAEGVNPDSDAEPVTVHSLAEAEQIYAGEIPAYTPPEGYALTEIEATPSQLDIRYENQNGDPGFSVTVYGSYDAGAKTYICENGTATPLTAPIAEIYPMDDDAVYSAYVTLPDETGLTFSFDDAVPTAELATYLGGLTE